MKLTDKTIKIIKATAPLVRGHIDEIISLFYKNLLSENDSLHNTFNQTHLITGKQQKALACAVIAYAENIENLEDLSNVVSLIANKHASFSVQPEQYEVVGKYLIEAIGVVLEEHLTEEIVAAWIEAYNFLAKIFITEEKKLYANSLLSGGWLGWKEFIVSKKIDESSEMTSFYLIPSDNSKLPSFKSGQSITIKVRLENSEYDHQRQYTISDQSGLDYLRISVKKEIIHHTSCSQNMVSHYLHNNINIGDKIMVVAPYGNFILNENDNPVVLISAGSGITPMISMINYLVNKKKHIPILFLYAFKSEAEHNFKIHIENLVKNNPQVKNITYCEHPLKHDSSDDRKGRMNLQDELLPQNGDYYISGPEGFIQAQIRTLQAIGIKKENIFFEEFGPTILECKQ